MTKIPEATDVVYQWLQSYTEEEIRNYPNKEDALYTIDEISFDANATMHHDDPSLINLFDQLHTFKKILVTEIEKETNG